MLRPFHTACAPLQSEFVLRFNHMTPNPLLGVIFHWLGGLASGSFYVPYRGVKRWSWETYWLIGGFFSWIIAPVTLGMLLTNDLPTVLREAPGSTLFWCYFWGMMWGLGGLTFGLTMRYLGMSLGMAVALGYCAAFGTLMPPIFDGVFVPNVLGTTSGRVILTGVAVCLSGIAFAGMAGMSKEREMPAKQKREVIKEFNLRKGILVATFSGVMSACFSYGLRAGDPIKAISLSHGTTTLWQGLPVLVSRAARRLHHQLHLVRALNIRNRTVPNHSGRSEYLLARSAFAGNGRGKTPMLANYLSARWRAPPGISSSSSTPWAKRRWARTSFPVGPYTWRASSSSARLWGIALHEWRGAGVRTKSWLAVSLAVLLLSTMVVGYGNYLGTLPH